MQSPKVFNATWDKYTGNCAEKMSNVVLRKLQGLYDIGKQDKKRKLSADRALQIILDEIISDNWDERLIVTVPRIKAFFGLTPAKQQNAIQDSFTQVEHNEFNVSVREFEEELVENDTEAAAESPLDIE